MQRRKFLATSGFAAAMPLQAIAAASDEQQFFEVIIYHTRARISDARNRVVTFYRDVALPAYQRLGIGPVGIFRVLYGPNQPSLYVLVPHNSLESAVTAQSRLMEDTEYRREGATFLESSLSDPAYVRQERQLLVAFTHMPRIEVPVKADTRIFELRVYESHSVQAGQKKIHMFNEGGEIAIFRKTGLSPIFFGETLFGPAMPNLTYMLGFDSMEERDKAWAQFVADPDWEKLRVMDEYRDTVSNISDIILRPLPFSQI